jgi:tetratricopeptide (TPR) repeat protein
MTDVFVIMPFGIKSSPQKEHTIDSIDFDTIYSNLIKPACEDAGLSVSRIDEIDTSGLISEQYLQAILEARIVICDVSLPNGNVYYELGIRQAISPANTILIALTGTKLPFDISHQRVIFYDPNVISNVSILSKAIKNSNEAIFANPVREYLEKVGAITNPQTNKISFEQDLNGRIERAKNADHLIGIWNWAKAFDHLPKFSLLTLAEKLSDLQQWDSAIAILKHLVTANKSDYELYRQLGLLIRRLNNSDDSDALDYLEKAYSLNPNDPETLGMIGGIYKRRGDYKKAKEFYSKGIQISPYNLYMRITDAAITYLENPDSKTIALEKYQNILNFIEKSTIDFSDSWLLVVKAEAHYALNDIDVTKKLFNEALKNADGYNAVKSAISQISLLGDHGLNLAGATEILSWFKKITLNQGAENEKLNPSQNDNELPVIIHLTDVHFGFMVKNSTRVDMHRFKDGEYNQPLEEHIKEEFSEYFKFDSNRLFLVVSGDFTYTANRDEFDMALNFMNKVCSALNINKEKVIVTLGNHDINWNSEKVDPSNRFDNYISFLNKFYGKALLTKFYPYLKWDLSIDTERPNPEDILAIHFYPEKKLLFISFNSCMYESNQNHFGFIGGKQFKLASKFIKENDINDSFTKVAITHHHLHPHPTPVSATNGDVWMDLSIVRDSGLVEYKLENMGVDIILHGHKHNPQLRETLVRDRKNMKHTKKLIICGGGSCGVNSTELEHNLSNQYQVIEFLNSSRINNVAFIKIVWRELEVNDAAEWYTSVNLILNG